MNHYSEKNWAQDFQEFLATESNSVPPELTKKILKHIQQDLTPFWFFTFIKLLTMHLFAGTLSLIICNQFGMSPFRTEFSLSEYFMHFGHSACMFFCGTLFVGISVFAFGFVVRPEELRSLRQNVVLQSAGLAVLSLFVFWLLGAEIALSIGSLWLLGALSGGILSSEVAFRLRLPN